MSLSDSDTSPPGVESVAPGQSLTVNVCSSSNGFVLTNLFYDHTATVSVGMKEDNSNETNMTLIT